MPARETVERGRERGLSPATRAEEFVREEIHHVREGKHGSRSTTRRSPLASRRREIARPNKRKSLGENASSSQPRLSQRAEWFSPQGVGQAFAWLTRRVHCVRDEAHCHKERS